MAEGRKAIGKEEAVVAVRGGGTRKRKSTRERQNPDFLISGSQPNTQAVGVRLMITSLPQERVRSAQQLQGADWPDSVSELDKFEKDLLSVASWLLQPRRPPTAFEMSAI